MFWIFFWALVAYLIGRHDGYGQAEDDMKRRS